MSVNTFNSSLFDYLDASPTPFHAVQEACDLLAKAGFQGLNEAESWQLEAGKSYYITRNDSSLIAFHYAHSDWEEKGCRLVGAHSDSPCLKVKPNALTTVKGYGRVGVEVYGGVLLNPWFDRDLSLAGRLVLKTESAEQKACLINFEKAIATIPSLAIHLDREANQNRSINPQKDICPVLLQTGSSDQTEVGGKQANDFETILLSQVAKQYPELTVKQVVDYELSFYDVQRAAQIGLNEEFITSARLDNLLSCYTGLSALIESGKHKQNALLVINDHEEVGSQTAQGAQGTFLSSVIERICGSSENTARCLAQSLLVSADNAHGIHPNFPEKHDAQHGPVLNQGVVIKVNANQRYASNSISSARFKALAEQAGELTQTFVVRSDMACGSTIGPLTAAELGVQTIDVGVPTFAMHSIRESAGSKDAFSLFSILKTFFESETVF